MNYTIPHQVDVQQSIMPVDSTEVILVGILRDGPASCNDRLPP